MSTTNFNPMDTNNLDLAPMELEFHNMKAEYDGQIKTVEGYGLPDLAEDISKQFGIEYGTYRVALRIGEEEVHF